MSESSDVYQLYRSLRLEHGRREIRVLVLEDPNPDDTVRCTIEKISVEDGPEFNALSYAWGDGKLEASIIINGISLPVTRSAENALRSLRNHNAASPTESPIRSPNGRIKPVWVDALCINQNHAEEKAEQVSMMYSIYSKASSVVVWMGDGTAHTDAAFDLMCGKARDLSSSSRSREAEPPFDTAISLFSTSAESRSLLQGQDTFPPTLEWMMLETVMKEDICKRPWWSRLWVRQEFVLSSSPPFMMCGAKGISWDWFIFYFVHLARLWSHPDNVSATQAQRNGITGEITASYGIHPISLHYLRENFKRTGALSLEKVFRYLVRNALATNPHDYVYGLLGLVADTFDAQIKLDYTRDCMELYKEVGVVLWCQEPHHMLAELVHLYQFHPEDNGHPSWIPDFRQSKLRAWQDRKALQANGVWRRLKVPCFDHAKDCLRLDGVCIDRIDAVYRTPETLPGHSELTVLLRQYERIFHEAQKRHVPPNHRLSALGALKKAESAMRILTRSSVAQMDGDERFHPRYADKDVWNTFLGRSTIEDLVAQDQTSRESLFLRLRRMLAAKIEGRCIFTTQAGFCGIGIPGIEVDDFVTVVCGASGPVILRPYDGFHRLVGSAYVSGLMDARILERTLTQNNLTEQKFEIR